MFRQSRVRATVLAVLTVPLGQTSKRRDGVAFDVDSWTTRQLVDVLGIDDHNLNKGFIVMNVFEYRQRAGARGFQPRNPF